MQDASERGLAVLHAKEVAGRWFGVAHADDGLVATAVGVTRAGTLAYLRRSLPNGVAHRVGDEDGSGFVERTIALLAELEAGRTGHDEAFSLSGCVGGSTAAVLRAAAAIPRGYVTSYGEIARVSGTDARDVGQVMASNPLYPIVPCHRVVGADLSLVGYMGSRGGNALQAKLDRLAGEASGAAAPREVLVEGQPLRCYPVEWAIARAGKRGSGDGRQGTLFVLALGAVLLLTGCDGEASRPSSDSLALSVAAPANGATVVVPEQYPYDLPGGVVLPPGSGLVSIRVQMAAAHDVPWAQLNLYLLTGGTTTDYCGQNLPDSPTWQFLTPGWAVGYTVTGFQVYRLPCDVTGVRAMLHMRNNGALAPPTASETIAEATVPAAFQLRR